jgi:hypothetical protein
MQQKKAPTDQSCNRPMGLELGAMHSITLLEFYTTGGFVLVNKKTTNKKELKFKVRSRLVT